MRRIGAWPRRLALALALVLGCASAASAANVTWNGAGINNLWSNGANWSSTFPPSIADVAVFDATSTKNCTIDVAVSITGISIAATYTGGAGSTITQNSGCTVVLGASGFVQAAGTFTTGGAATDQLVTPVFNQTAGTFNGSGTVLVVSSTSQNFNATSTLPNVVLEASTEYGLYGYWKMDSTGASEPDSSGRGHTLSLNNAPTSSTAHATTQFYDPRSRTLDNGENADGTAGGTTTRRNLFCADHADFNCQGAFSAACWVRPGATSDQQYLVKHGNYSTTGFNLLIDGTSAPRWAVGSSAIAGSPLVTWGGAGARSQGFNGAVWYHLCGVWDGASTTLYVNGTSVATAALSSPPTVPTGDQFLVGDTRNTPKGEVDEVRFYNRALAPIEVAALAAGFYGPGRSSGVTFTLTNALTVSGDLTVVSGALDVSGSNRAVTVGGSLRLYGDFTAQAGTVTLNGTGSKTLHTGGNRFNNLTISNSGTWTMDDRLDVAGTLAISAGVLDVSTSNWSVHAGTLNQTAASTSIVPRSGRLVMDGSAGGSITATTALSTLRIEDPTEQDLVGYWKFDLPSGSSERDVSGTGVTATPVNGVVRSTSTPSAVLFDDPASAQLDGSSGYYDLGSAAGLNFAANAGFAVCGWINTTDSYGPIVSLRATVNDNAVFDLCVGFDGLDGTISAGKLFCLQRDDGNGTISEIVGGTINSGSWRHFALVRATTGYLTAYIDGASQGTSSAANTGSITTNLRALGLERKWLATGAAPNQNVPDKQYLNGSIDDVRVYNRALTAAEVRNLANGRYVSGTSGTSTWTLAANLATATLGIDAGTFNANGFTTTVANLFTLQQGQGGYTAGSKVQTFNGGMTISGSTYTGGTGMTIVNGPFTQVATVDANGAAAQSGGTFVAPSASMVVTGDFSDTAGTFTHNSGTVVLKSTASRTVTSTQTFNHLAFGDGLIGYWRMEDVASPSVDESGLGHDATWSTATRDTSQKPTLATANASAMSFNGSSEQMLPTASPYFDLQRYSFTCWERCSTTWSASASMLGYNVPGGGNLGYSFETSGTDSSLSAWIYQTVGGWQSVTAAGWTKGTWEHYGTTFDGTTMRMYRNGIEVGTPTTTASNSIALGAGMAPRIGRHPAAAQWFNGHLDELRLYDRALDAGSMARIYSGGVPATSGTWSLGSALTAAGNVTIASGAVVANGNDINLAGSWKNLGGTFAPGTRTVTFNGAASGKTIESRGQPFYHLSVASSPSGGVWTLADRLDVSGTLSISAGQLDVSTSNWPIHCGTLNQTGVSTTLVPRSGTIVLDSATGGSIRAATTLNAVRIEDPSELDLVGHWKFDLQSCDSERDLSGSGNTATYTNGASHSTAVPTVPLFENSGSASFDGVDDYLTIADSASLDVTAITISAWIKPSTLAGGSHDIVSKWFSATQQSYNLRLTNAGFINVDISTNGSNDLFPPDGTAITAGSWYHVAMTYDGSRLKSFINGTLNAAVAASGAIFNSTAPVYIGRFEPTFAAGRYFPGLIDDVRIYSRALTDGEVRNLANGRYAAGANGTATTTLAANLAATTLAVDAGTFDANGFATTLGGLFTMAQGQGVYTAGSGTQTFNGGLTMTGGTFTGGTGTVAVNGGFTQSATVDANGGAPQSGGAFTAPSTTMTITGSVVAGGTFAPNGGTVQLNGGSAGNTLTGVPRGGGLVATFFAGSLRAVYEDDWRSSRTARYSRLDTTINYPGNSFGTAAEWAASGAGTSSADWDDFSVQWDGWITVATDGTTLKTRSDDSSRVWIDQNADGVVQVGEWGKNGWGGGQAVATRATHYRLAKGTYRIRVQYEEGNVTDTMMLAWDDSTNSAGLTPDSDYLVPSTMLTPATATTAGVNANGLTFADLQVTGAGSWAVNDRLIASGAITCSAGTLTQGTGGEIRAASWSQAGGTFTGSNAGTTGENITLSGAFSCTSGTFTSTRSSLNVAGDFTVGGSGTFAHNSGAVELRPSATRSLSCTQAFNDLRINDGLVAYWSFDEASSPAVDLTGRGHDAAWIGTPTPTTTVLAPTDVANPRAMALNGTSQYLLPRSQYDFALTRATVAAWLYFPSSATWSGSKAVFNRQTLSGTGYTLETSNNGYVFFVNSNGTNISTASFGSLSPDRWYHVAGTFDGTTARLYVDGYENIFPSTPPGSAVGSMQDLVGATDAIGRNEWNQTQWFPGTIDELRVYDRALSLGEVQRLGQRHDPGAYLNTVNLATSLDVNGDLALLSGRLDVNGAHDITVAGSWLNRGGAFDPETRTVTFDGAAAGKSIRCGYQPFYNLNIAGTAAGAWTATDQLRVGGAFTLGTGVFTAPSTRMVVNGNFTVSGGTFNHGSGTVIMKSTTGTTLSSTQPFNHLVFSDGLIAHWRFEEAASPFLDSSGWGHTATTVVAPTPDAAVKPVLASDNARSLTFDGSTTYLSVVDETEFQPINRLSIATWLYVPTGLAAIDEGCLFGRAGDSAHDPGGSGGDNRGWRIDSRSVEGEWMFRARGTVGLFANVTATGVGRDAWHHLAFTLDSAGNWRGYLDGALNVAQNYGLNTVINPADGRIWIGRQPNYPYNYAPKLNGKLDGLRFYDRDLSAAEVVRLAAGREPATSVATFTLGSNITVAGDLTIGSGTLDLNSRSVGVAGNWRCEGVVTGGTSTVTFNGVSQTGKTIASGNQSLANVAIAGSLSDWTCSDAFSATGTFTQSGSTFVGNAKRMAVGGDLSLAGGVFQATNDVLTCAGAVSDAPSGLFVANTGFVELTAGGAKALNMTDAFNHLTIRSGGDSRMVVRLRFDEPAGNTAFDDVSGNGIGSYVGTPTPYSATTAYLRYPNPYCLDFNGAESGSDLDYVSIASTATLNTLNEGDYTISAWYRPDVLPVENWTTSDNRGRHMIVGKAGWNEGLSLRSDGVFAMTHWTTGNGLQEAVSTSSFTAGTWYHLAGVVDKTNGETRIYVNGVLQGVATWTPGLLARTYASQTWNVGVGRTMAVGEDYLWPADGKIDDVRLYSGVLSPAEISALADNSETGNGTGTITLGTPLDVNGDLSFVSGTLATGALQVNAAANWLNYRGIAAFTSSGTVVLDGASQRLVGSTNFNAFTKTSGGATLTFPVNECQTFAGALTLQGTGAGASLMNIRSSSPGTRATIRPTGTRTVAFLSVMDSRNFVLPILAPRATTNCVDAGNTRWWFDGTAGGNGVLVGAPGLD